MSQKFPFAFCTRSPGLFCSSRFQVLPSRFTAAQLHVLTSVPLYELVSAVPGPQKALGIRSLVRLLCEYSSLPPEDSPLMFRLESEAEQACRSLRASCTMEQRLEGWEQARVLLHYWERMIWCGDRAHWQEWKRWRPAIRCFRPAPADWAQ